MNKESITTAERLERIERLLAISNKDVLNIAECAAYLGYERTTLYNKCERREIPYYKKGKVIRFSKKEIDSWLLEGSRVPTKSEIENQARNISISRRK